MGYKQPFEEFFLQGRNFCQVDFLLGLLKIWSYTIEFGNTVISRNKAAIDIHRYGRASWFSLNQWD